MSDEEEPGHETSDEEERRYMPPATMQSEGRAMRRSGAI
jgi:hypothetical protein